jgi:hypothetical protein
LLTNLPLILSPRMFSPLPRRRTSLRSRQRARCAINPTLERCG